MMTRIVRLAPVSVALAVFTGLLAYGAGIFTWTVMASTMAGSLVLMPGGGAVARADARVLRVGAILLAFVLLSLAPLPLGLSRVTGMRRYRQNEAVARVARDMAAVTNSKAPRLTFAATRNRAGTMRMVLLGLLAASGAGMGRRFTPRQRGVCRGWLVAAGCVTAGAGFAGRWVAPQGDRLWYWIPVAHGLPGPVAGFINPNHYAGFLALLLPLAMVAAAGALLPDGGSRGFRRGIRLVGGLAGALLLMAGIATSLSRGGLVAAAAGSVVTLLVLARDRPRLRWGAAVCLPLLAAVVLLSALQLPTVAQRLASLRDPLRTDSVVERLAAWRGALRVWRHYPLTGCGLNAFRVAYPQARHTTERDYRTFAENEYAQWPAETGVIGVALAIALLAAIAQRWRGGMGSYHDRPTIASAEQSSSSGVILSEVEGSPIEDACLAGIVTVAAVHACVDFVPRLPLYAFTLAILIAMHPRFALPPAAASGRCLHAPAAVCLLIALVLLPWVRAAQQRDALGFVGYADAGQLVTALAWAPVSPHLWVRLAERFEQSGEPDLMALAGPTAWRGGLYDPNNYRLWLRIGHLLKRTGDRDGAATAFAEVRRLRDWVPVPTLD